MDDNSLFKTKCFLWEPTDETSAAYLIHSYENFLARTSAQLEEQAGISHLYWYKGDTNPLILPEKTECKDKVFFWVILVFKKESPSKQEFNAIIRNPKDIEIKAEDIEIKVLVTLDDLYAREIIINNIRFKFILEKGEVDVGGSSEGIRLTYEKSYTDLFRPIGGLQNYKPHYGSLLQVIRSLSEVTKKKLPSPVEAGCLVVWFIEPMRFRGIEKYLKRFFMVWVTGGKKGKEADEAWINDCVTTWEFVSNNLQKTSPQLTNKMIYDEAYPGFRYFSNLKCITYKDAADSMRTIKKI